MTFFLRVMRYFLFHILALMEVFHVLAQAPTFDSAVSSLTQSSLPQVNIAFSADSTSRDYFVPGDITIAQYGEEDVTHKCLIRRRGKTSVFLPKKSYSIKLVDDNGENVDDNLLNLRTDNTWILDAMAIDKLRMRNRVIFDIWNEFSHTMWSTNYGNRNGTVGTMVEVYVNNHYNGIYCLSDKVNRQLLNLRKAKVNDDGSVTVKGLLYKGKGNGISNALLDYDTDRTDTTLWNTIELQYPDQYPSLATWQPLMDLIDFNGKTEMEYFKQHYQEWYYVDNLVDYWVLLVAFGIDDMPYKNTYISTPDINFEHRYMITPWDLDASLGRGCDGSEVQLHSSLSRLNDFAPYNRLVPYNIDGFKNLLARRWEQLVEAELSPSRLRGSLTAIAQRYIESGAWQREAERWGGTSIDIVQDIDQEIEYVMSWYQRNTSYVSGQIKRWRDDYVEDDVITASTVTAIYNFLLGTETSYNNKLDLNHDGVLNSVDITVAYNYLLGSDSLSNY